MATTIITAILMCLFVSGTVTLVFNQVDKGKFDNIPGTIIMTVVSILLIFTLLGLL